MKYWPQLKQAEGFSIGKLARKAKEKIVKTTPSFSTEPKEVTLSSLSNDSTAIEFPQPNNVQHINSITKSRHWANRDFDEYRKAA